MTDAMIAGLVAASAFLMSVLIVVLTIYWWPL